MSENCPFCCHAVREGAYLALTTSVSYIENAEKTARRVPYSPASPVIGDAPATIAPVEMIAADSVTKSPLGEKPAKFAPTSTMNTVTKKLSIANTNSTSAAMRLAINPPNESSIAIIFPPQFTAEYR